LAAVFALALVFTALPGTNWTAPTDPGLVAGDYALVQVAHGAANAVAAKATAAGATDVAALDTIDVVTARLSADALRALQRDPRVAFLGADAIVTAAGGGVKYEKPTSKPITWVDAINAKKAWALSTGRGVTVALMDTGVAEHPDLAGSVLARVDFVQDGETQLDPSGHGTFVAGLIAAHGTTFKGVAPDSKLVSLRVLDRNGTGSMHAVLAAFDWLLRNRATYGIRVLNLSFGAPQTGSYQTSLLAGLVESAWFAGLVVTAAAGNDGPAAGTVASPGADPFVVTVGSIADQGTASWDDDRLSNFSGRGPTKDGFAKPDILAPGEHVVSLRVPGSELDNGTTSDSLYARLTGTSASTAMVAGVAALVLQVRSDLTATKVKGAIVTGSRKIGGTPTPAANAAAALGAKPAKVNVGLVPSAVLLTVLQKSGQLGSGVDWTGVSWEGISWESVTWEGVTWESVSWESVTWEGVGWEAKS
jgi:serine protease AprX